MKTVEIVEEFILKKMAKLIPLPAECYKTQINDKKSKQQDQSNIFNDEANQYFLNLIDSKVRQEATDE